MGDYRSQLGSNHRLGVPVPAYGMNFGRMLVRRNVNVWNREKVANGMIDTGTVSANLSDMSWILGG